MQTEEESEAKQEANTLSWKRYAEEIHARHPTLPRSLFVVFVKMHQLANGNKDFDGEMLTGREVRDFFEWTSRQQTPLEE